VPSAVGDREACNPLRRVCMKIVFGFCGVILTSFSLLRKLIARRTPPSVGVGPNEAFGIV